MQNFSFQGSTRTFFTSCRFRLASRASGFALRQTFWVFGLTAVFLSFIDSPIVMLRASQRTLAPPLDRNSGFRNFSYGFAVNRITIQNFNFIGHLEVTIFARHQVPLDPPFNINLRFPLFLGQP